MFGNSNYSVGDYASTAGNFRLHFFEVQKFTFSARFRKFIMYRSITILYPFVCLWLFHCDYSFWGNALAILSSSFLQYCENVFDGRIFLVHTYTRVARYLVMSALTHLFLDSTVYVYICKVVKSQHVTTEMRDYIEEKSILTFFFISFFKTRI